MRTSSRVEELSFWVREAHPGLGRLGLVHSRPDDLTSADPCLRRTAPSGRSTGLCPLPRRTEGPRAEQAGSEGLALRSK